ncbi:hypothetical protein PRJ_3625 [Pseudomonas sp. XWY-1]|nr:hypothetical protein PRJ_3625 [Pseudomonas sp. XWY-1]
MWAKNWTCSRAEMAPASPVFAGKPAPTAACVHPPMCVYHQSV